VIANPPDQARPSAILPEVKTLLIPFFHVSQVTRKAILHPNRFKQAGFSLRKPCQFPVLVDYRDNRGNYPKKPPKQAGREDPVLGKRSLK
jgi:hypothetical protein